MSSDDVNASIELDPIKLLEEIDALKKENEKQKQEFNKYNVKVESWKEKMKQISIKEATKMKELDTMIKIQEEKITKYRTQEESTILLVKTVQSMMDQTNSNLLSHVEKVQTVSNERIAKLAENVTRLKVNQEKRLKRLHEKEKETERKLKMIQEQSESQTQDDFQKLRLEIETLTQQLVEKEDVIQDLNKEQVNLNNIKSNLEKQNFEDKEAIEALKTQLTDVKQQNQGLTQTIQQLNQQISTTTSVRSPNYKILEHVVFDDVNWCLIEEEEGQYRWVSDVPKDDLPDSLQEALQEEFEKELTIKQESFEKELSLKMDEKDEELRKYRARAVTALKKKTEELTSEKTQFEERFMQVQQDVHVEQQRYTEMEKKNHELKDQIQHLVEFQTKFMQVSDQVDELDKEKRDLKETIDNLEEDIVKIKSESQSEISSLMEVHANKISELMVKQSELEEEYKKNNKISNEKQKRVVSEYEREIERLKKTIAELEEALRPKLTQQAKEKSEMNEFLELAQLQASRDQEMMAYKEKIHELQEQIEERKAMEDQVKELEENLKEEREKITRFEFRENANLEYLKNILIKYFESNEAQVQQKLLTVVATVLAFSPEEKKKIEKTDPKKDQQWSIGSMFRGSPQK